MNGTSGFQEVRASRSRSPSCGFLHEQQHQFGEGAWHLLNTHDLIAPFKGISTKGEMVPAIRTSGFESHLCGAAKGAAVPIKPGGHR